MSLEMFLEKSQSFRWGEFLANFRVVGHPGDYSGVVFKGLDELRNFFCKRVQIGRGELTTNPQYSDPDQPGST